MFAQTTSWYLYSTEIEIQIFKKYGVLIGRTNRIDTILLAKNVYTVFLIMYMYLID